MTPPGSSEWVRIIDIRHLSPGAQDIVADDTARRRLAGRFGLTAIDRLIATVTFEGNKGTIGVTGRIRAEIVQACAISGEDFAVTIDAPVDLRFVPALDAAGPGDRDAEIEITADDCDEIDYTGVTFDLGEALAQTLALSIDPFAQGPDADRARAEHGLAGLATNGAFAALAALKHKE